MISKWRLIRKYSGLVWIGGEEVVDVVKEETER